MGTHQVPLHMGMEREQAEVAVDSVSTVVVRGQCELWAAFSEQARVVERGGGVEALVGVKAAQRVVIEEVLAKLSRVQRGVLLDGQDRVLRMRTAKREACMVR